MTVSLVLCAVGAAALDIDIAGIAIDARRGALRQAEARQQA